MIASAAVASASRPLFRALALIVAALGLVLRAAPATLPTYGAAQPQFVLNQPGRISMSGAADFNCDGLIDVAFVRGLFGTGTLLPVNIVLANGSGGYVDGTASIYSGPVPQIGWLAGKMLIDDYNGDGRPDIFIPDPRNDTSTAGYHSTLILSTSDCHLTDATANIPQTYAWTHSATVADIDNDGDVDIYMGNIYNDDHVGPQIWVNDGTGHFTVSEGRLPAAQIDLTQNRYTASLFVDVDGDGNPDLVLGGENNTPQSAVLLNDGAGYFSLLPNAIPAKPFPVNSYPLSLDIRSADFNHDGKPDLALVFTKFDPYYKGRWLQLLVNDGSGHFTDETATRLFPTQVDNVEPYYMLLAHFVDFDGDGNHDLIGQLIDYHGGHQFYTASGAGVFTQAASFLSGQLADVFSLVDAKGDGHRDVLNIGYSGTDQDLISLVPNTGPVVPPGIPLDVTATRGLGTHIRVRWPYVWGATSYEIWRSSTPGAVGTLVNTVTATTFDDASVPDPTEYYRVRAVNSAGTSGYSLVARGALPPPPPGLPSFGSAQQQFVLNQIGRLEMSATADFNCDGRVDVAFVRNVSGTATALPVTLVAANGSGGFVDGTAQVFTGAAPSVVNPQKILVDDFNGDGRPDMFVANQGASVPPYAGAQNTLMLSTPDCHLIDATAGLPQQSDYTISAAAADVDADGDVDLFVGNTWGGNLIPPQIWLNDGAGHFTVAAGRLPAAQTDLNQNRYSASLFADVDGDGDADLVLGAEVFSAQSAVLLNDGLGYFSLLSNALPAKAFGASAFTVDVKSLDINHDGAPDLAMVSTKNFFYSGRWIQLLINNGAGVFTDATSSRLLPVQSDNNLTAYRFAHFVDLNGDGYHDLIGQLFANTDGHKFFKADGTGVFSSVTFLSGALADVFALVDANGNGHRDVLDVGYAATDQDRISLIPNTGPVQPPGSPLDVTATRGLNGHIRVRWPYVWGATQYEVWRSPSPSANGALIATVAATSLDDGAPTGGADYYRVRALNAAGPSGYSAAARGLAIVPDDPITGGLTIIRALDITRLRTRIDAARRRYGLVPFAYTDPVLIAGMIPKAVHIVELRASIAQVYATAHLTAPAFTDPALSQGTVAKAVHILELRAATSALP